MKELLKSIRDNNILLDIVDGKLSVFSSESQIDSTLLTAIRARENELMQFLLNNVQYSSSGDTDLDIPVTAVQRDYVLSSAQRRLWILSQRPQASVAYNMPGAYVFEGSLNMDALEQSFRRLLQRHESLRTVFRENEQGEVRQHILSPEEALFRIAYHDLRRAAVNKEMIGAKVKEEFVRPFDLALAPLLRASLFQLEDHRWIFTYVMHHIIGDGWSMGVLINELLLLYHACLKHEEDPLPSLRIQYKDYAAWQQTKLNQGYLDVHKTYWLKQMQGGVPVLELPADKVRPRVKTYNGATLSAEISAHTSKQLKMVSQQQGGTLFMGLLAVINALFYRYTGQDDITIGSPIAGRDHIDLEKQIGFYVNMLALRTRFSGENTFRDLLNIVKKTTLNAYEHQAYPFDQLVEEARITGDPGRHPLFDVVVVLQNNDVLSTQAMSAAIGEFSVSSYDNVQRNISLFDLRFEFTEVGDEIKLAIDYNSDIYEAETINNLIGHFIRMTEAVAADPEKKLAKIGYLSEKEKHFLLNDCNAMAVRYPEEETIVTLFEKQVRQTPDSIAVVFDGTAVSYHQLNERANQFAHFLISEIGLEREEGVGLFLNRGLDCIASMLGILKAGGMYIPFETDTPEDRLKFMVNDTGIRVLITERTLIEKANRLQWSGKSLQSYLCVDTLDVYDEREQEENMKMSQEIWDHVGERSTDQITGGGWINSFTGQPIAAEEMEEYAMNVYKKLSGLLHSGMRVLEIGCSSGLTLCKIAPEVGSFYGTDLSPVILQNTSRLVAERGWHNVKLRRLAAHEIAMLEERDFDLIIMNSVIQHFHGHNYLRKVIADAIALLSNEGYIFIGDVMDINQKDDLMKDLTAFRAQNNGKGDTTNTDFSAELFVARDFFDDLMFDEKSIQHVNISNKIYTLENELTKYRYDVVLHINKQNRKAPAHKRNKRQYSNAALSTQAVHDPGVNISPDALAYLIYTSGTTGRPKGVMVQHSNVVRLFKNDKPLFDFGRDDVWTMFHSYCFDFSVWEIYGALLFGGRLVLVSKAVAQDPEAFLQLLSREQVTVLNQTPSAFYNLSKQEHESEAHKLRLRYIIFGGEALSPGRLKEWRTLYPATKLINMYGITETTVHVTYKEITISEIESNSSNIGKPIPTLSCYVLDKDQCLLPVGLPGELYVGGKGVARGYLNRDELNRQRFIANPFSPGERMYRTGDRVKRLRNGEMEYISRIDDQVKIRGFRIELGEIEHALTTHEQVREAVVLPREDRAGDKILVAYIVGKGYLTVAGLRAYLERKLPEYMLPAHYVVLPELPLTANGKIDKKALPGYEAHHVSSGIQYVAPRSELETKLVAIVSNVLNISGARVGIHDNFFSLGGDSIKAMKLVVQIRKQVGQGMTIGELYKHQTVAELSGWLKKNAGNDDEYKNLEKGLKQIREIREAIEAEDKLQGKLPALYEDIYPLSKIEQGMIYSSMLNPEAPVYYDQFIFFVQISNWKAFGQAMEKLVDRHAILRTTYHLKNFNHPVKVVLKRIELPLSYRNVSSKAETEKEQIINNFLEKDQMERFSFDGELLWRVNVFQVSDTEYTIIWSCHHAILDGWSMSVISRELFGLLARHSKQSLPPLKYSYKDYCAILLGREISPTATGYWQTMLAGYTRNKLPFNFKGIPIDKSALNRMDRVADTASDDLLRKLDELSARHQLSFKAICLAAQTYLLHIICSEQEVVTGVVTHDRPEIEDSDYILGCFLNTVPISVNFGSLHDVLSLLKHVNRYLVEVRPHEIHLSDIAKVIDVKTSGGNPIFDTILNYTDFQLYRQLEDDAFIRAVEPALNKSRINDPNQMTNTLFDVEVDRTMSRLDVSIKYVPAYFHKEDVAYALDLYLRILASFTADVDAPLASLNILTAGEYKEILVDFNNTAAPYSAEKTIHQLFEERAFTIPRHTALRQHGKEVSYGELNGRANQLARHLVALGVKPGDNVGLLVARNFDMIIGMYGILKAGGAYVPIDPEYPADRQEYIISNSDVAMVLTDAPYLVTERQLNAQFIFMDDEKTAAYSSENLHLQIDSRQLAYTIYTSGSTGRPKGVMIEHHSAVNLIEWVNDEVNVGQDDRLLFITSMCFDLSVYDIFGILAAGGTIVIVTQEEVQQPEALKQLLRQERITFWDSVPTTMNYLVNELEADDEVYTQHNLRVVFLSGDWIPVQLPGRITRYFPNAKVVSLGGATEGTVWSNYYPVERVDESWSSIPYGKPIRNNCFYILDGNERPVPKGVAGELYIGGVGVARGYANDAAKTAYSFRRDPFNADLGGRMYRTGDLGRLLRDGNMEFLGRKDNQVKIRGYRVELGEIESVLLHHEKIKEAIVDVDKDANNNNQLCAYLVLHEDIDKGQLRDMLKEALPGYMVPTRYVVLDALPLTSNGKINRKALPRNVGNIDEPQVEYIPPASTLEKQIERIWTSILKTERLGRKEDLFEAGANSLSVSAFVNRIQRELKVSLTIREVFVNPTVEGLGAILKNRRRAGFERIDPAGPMPSYPLSSSQHRLWVLNQFEEGNLSYYIPGVYVFTGDLNVDALSYAFNKLVERHEILRTVFLEDDGGTVRQFICPAEEMFFEIPCMDISLKNTSETAVHALIHKELTKPFDLTAGPLIRASLFRTAAHRWVFAVTIHHIISDGWSIGILIRELLLYYNAHVADERFALPPLRIQYKDYALWQRKQLEGEAFNIHKAYWLKQFEGPLPVLDFPMDKWRPAVKTYRGGTVKTKLDATLTGRLKALCRERGNTLFMGLLSATNALLYRYTGQDDIIIGTPVAGRDHPDLEKQIGFYVNTLALRLQFTGDNSSLELLEKIRQTTLEAYEHQMYPFDELVNELPLQRDISRNPLFDVMVVLQNNEVNSVKEQLSMQGLSVEEYEGYESLGSKFDLVFDFLETGGEVQLRIEYNCDLFNADTIIRLAKHYAQLLDAMLKDPSAPLKKLDYLSEEERRQVLESFNDTDHHYPEDKSIVDLLEQQVAASPDRIAVVFEGKEFTYRELNEKSNQLARYLRTNYRLGKGDLVGVKLKRSEYLVIALCAVLKAGCAYVPVDPDFPEERINYILNDSACKVLIDEGVLERFEAKKETYGKDNLATGVGPHDTMYVLYTSGSTGKPKGCLLKHKGIVNRIDWMWKQFSFSKREVILQKTTFTFDVSVWELFMPLCYGAKMVMCSTEDIAAPDRILHLIATYKVTCLHFVPGMLNSFITSLAGYDNAPRRLRSLKKVITSGEALSAETVRNWYALTGAPLHNLYGPTEASVDVTYYTTSSQDDLIPIGRPIWNTRIYILGPAGLPQPVGVNGEICIGGHGLATGYLNKPELTREKFVSDPFRKGEMIYRTGDTGRWMPDGTIAFIGRMDEQVKIRGHRIELREIEETLQRHPDIQSVVVSVTSAHNSDKELVAFINGKTADVTELKSFLAKYLPTYMVPARFVSVETWPLTPSGKIDRKKLSDLEENLLHPATAFAAPENEIEERLVSIWEAVLQRKSIGVLHNFFDLGGHSLKAIGLMNKIKHAFGVSVNLRDVFQNPDIRALGREIRKRQWALRSSEAGVKEEAHREIVKV